MDRIAACHCRLHDPPGDPIDHGDQVLLHNVREFGWHLVLIPDDAGSAGWTFSVGMSHTLGASELAMFGVPSEHAAGFLNAIGERLRAGERVADGTRLSGVLANDWPVVFRTVDPSWHRPLFGYAMWFVQRPPLRILQVCWPDREGRYPGDPAASAEFGLHQPSLWIPTREHPLCDWTGAIPEHQWRFPVWPTASVYLSSRVARRDSPVVHVLHDTDGDWLFADGSNSYGPGKVDLGYLWHVIRADRTLETLADLEVGWEARRTEPGGPWHRRRID